MKSPPNDKDRNIDRLLQVMAALRDPAHGCPWDVAQTFATIAPYTIEEAYEVADAIAHGDMVALKDELGDLLLQVAYHARMAEEAGSFDFDAVAGAIADKMIRRHPHVFGDSTVETAAAQTLAWEERKAAERIANKAEGIPHSVLDGVALALPSLLRAEKLQKRAARVGFDWPDIAQVFAKIDEELAELKEEINKGAARERVQDEVGDLLFVAANLARHLEVDPEQALRDANEKFARRFRKVEAILGDKLQASSLDEMEAAWQQAKRDEV